MGTSRFSIFFIGVLSILLGAAAFPILSDYSTADTTGEWKYHTSAEITSLMEGWAGEHPDITYYSTAQEMVGTRTITGERKIPLLFLGDMGDDERPWVMFIGAHHGDEPDSAEAVLGFARYMLDGWESGDRDIQRIVDSLNIAILPVVNPYGLDMDTRYDENGEDPNRDYPFAPEFVTSSSDGVPLTTAGAYTIHSLARDYPFSTALSFHTGSEGIYTPWGADGVENITPDGSMFNDMGKVLSKASGEDLAYGPANDYSGLGYLRGAFDDHLYGSMFYSQMLDDVDNILPWSTATATIELISSKGQRPYNLGNLEGVNDIGGPDDGTVPMGVRMCLAACELAAPSMNVITNGSGVEVTVNGPASEPEVLGSIEMNGTILRGTVKEHGEHHFLPRWSCRVTWNGIDEDLPRNTDIKAEFDGGWTHLIEGSDPEISPVSLLSLSRMGDNNMLSWTEHVEGTVEPGVDPVSPEKPVNLLIGSIMPGEQEVGRSAEITLTIPSDIGTIENLTITADVNGTLEITRIEDVHFQSWTYEFLTPIIEGMAEVSVNLTTDNGSFFAEDTMYIYPRVYINKVLREPNQEAPRNDLFRVIIGVDGGRSETPIFYGLSRSLSTGWTDNGWAKEPAGVVSNEFGPHTMMLDLNDLGGELYLRVCHHPGGKEDHHLLHLSTEPRSSLMPVREEKDELVIGPGIFMIDWDGLEEIDHKGPDLQITCDLFDEEEIIGTFELVWIGLSMLNASDRDLVLNQARDLSMDTSKITGAWYGIKAIPIERKLLKVMLNITGQITMEGGSSPIDVDIHTELEFSSSKNVYENESKGPGFPYSLLIFFLLIALFVLFLSFIRRDAHMVEKEGIKTDGPKRRYRDRSVKKESTDTRRAPPPPWGRLK
ncbi:MAG: M14 family metallopeptidase [Candidatus Thermoplasmatota archaeon]|nr:M14 family metallopeptidase [Candidatus Thermoplasmatota archaeon]